MGQVPTNTTYSSYHSPKGHRVGGASHYVHYVGEAENTSTGGKVIKIKGLSQTAFAKNKISLDSLSVLLNKDYKLAYNQIKWLLAKQLYFYIKIKSI